MTIKFECPTHREHVPVRHPLLPYESCPQCIGDRLAVARFIQAGQQWPKVLEAIRLRNQVQNETAAEAEGAA